MKNLLIKIVDHAVGIPLYILMYAVISVYLLILKVFSKPIALDETEKFYH